MADKTFLDDLIDYKHQVIADIGSADTIVGLLLNDPKVDMQSDSAYNIVGTKIFDYDYIDKTVQENEAYIMVDAEMAHPTSGTMNQWWLYVQIVCTKDFNSLNPKLFKGVVGNRRDNLAKQIDLRINGRRDFGIGRLELYSVNPASVPDTFTSLLLTYKIHEFRQERLSHR